MQKVMPSMYLMTEDGLYEFGRLHEKKQNTIASFSNEEENLYRLFITIARRGASRDLNIDSIKDRENLFKRAVSLGYLEFIGEEGS